jgi:hypothetical protein
VNAEAQGCEGEGEQLPPHVLHAGLRRQVRGEEGREARGYGGAESLFWERSMIINVKWGEVVVEVVEVVEGGGGGEHAGRFWTKESKNF